MATLKPHKITHTKTETMILTKDVLKTWHAPPFQRALRVNAKVIAASEEIKRDEGIVPGVLTLGVLSGKTYLLDGQHRVEAFKMSGLTTGLADVRTMYCDSMAEMGDEFVKLNSRLVNFKPDDIIKGLEASQPAIQLIRKRCPFVGYDNIRRGTTAPVVSMSAVLRCWDISSPETPTGTSAAGATLATTFTTDEAETLCSFLNLCFEAWGRDPEYGKLWGSLNLILCMWMYRRTVVTAYSPSTARITKDQFRKCLMSLSAESRYVDWLTGRRVGEKDRSPAYARLKAIFAHRIQEDTSTKPRLPAPAWAHGGGARPSMKPERADAEEG